MGMLYTLSTLVQDRRVMIDSFSRARNSNLIFETSRRLAVTLFFIPVLLPFSPPSKI